MKRADRVHRSGALFATLMRVDIALVLLGLSFSAGHAVETGHRSMLTMSFANDFFSGDDAHYSNGIAFSWVGEPLTDDTAEAFTWLPGLASLDRQFHPYVTLSHRLFTPRDTETRKPVRDDVPYSAFALIGIGISAQNDVDLHAWSITGGVVGPSAQGEELQQGVHDILGGDLPKGWDNQLDDEIVATMAYAYRRRIHTWQGGGGWNGDVLAAGSLQAGNLLSMATGGMTVRYGQGVRRHFAMPPAFLGNASLGNQSTGEPPATSSWYGYATLNASAIAQAIFWDGNSDGDSLSVDYEPWMARAILGLRWEGARWGAGLEYVFATIPWDNPSGRDVQIFGRLRLDRRF